MDYELAYEARRLSGDDFFAAATFPVGDSYLTLVNGGWGGHYRFIQPRRHGCLADESGWSFKFEAKRWYRFRVDVTGKMIRCWIDDKEITSVNYEDRRLSTRLETSPEPAAGFRHLEYRRGRPRYRDSETDGCGSRGR